MNNVSSSNGLDKLVPKLRFPEFSEEWQTVKLSDFVERITRKNNKNQTNLPLTISSKDGLVDQITYFSKTVASKDMSGYYLLMNGEFAYNKSYSVGYDFGSIKRLDRYPMGALSTLYICFTLKKYDSDFMKFYFDSLKWYREIYMIAAEGARNHGLLNVPTEAFFETRHTLPMSIAEQQKIASFLTLIDKRIAKQRELVESLKSYKRGVFLELYKTTVKRTVFFKEIYLKAAEGGTPSTAISEYYYNGTIPFAKIEDLSQHYLFCTKSFITEKGLCNSSAWLIPQGSVIFSNGATIGACSINKIDVATKQGILGIVPKEDYLSEYLYHFFTSKIFLKKVKAVTTKGTMDCVYLKDLDYIKIEIPEYNEQLRIGSILNKIEDKLEKNVTILQKLQCIKNGLLQQLFI